MKQILFILFLGLVACQKTETQTPVNVTPKAVYDTILSTNNNIYGDTIHGYSWQPDFQSNDFSAHPALSVWMYYNGWHQLPLTGFFMPNDSIYSIVNVANMAINYKFGIHKYTPPTIQFRIVIKNP